MLEYLLRFKFYYSANIFCEIVYTMASFGRIDGSEVALNKRLDATNWSTSSAASTKVDSQGGKTLQVIGDPASPVFVTLQDLYNGQQFTVLNITGQDVSVMDDLTYGSTTIWTQNSTSSSTVSSGGSVAFLFYIDNSNPSLGHVMNL